MSGETRRATGGRGGRDDRDRHDDEHDDQDDHDHDDDDFGDDVADAVDDVVDGVRRGKRTPLARALARAGMASRAVVYGALAVVVVQLALVGRSGATDQAGALTAIGAQPAGVVVLWLLAVGVTLYSLWRLAEALAGPAAGRDTKGERLKALAEGVAYLPIAVISVSVASGDPERARQGDRYRSLSARVMQDWTGGRWLIGLVGLVVVGIGLYLASEGPRRSFREDLDFGGRRRAEQVVVPLGIVGSTARGVVFALAGVLVVAAAVTDDADKAGGVDAALRSVADEPYGPVLLLAVAAGLACYAGFAVGEAAFRRL